MPDTIPTRPATASPLGWTGDITRVPYWVYRDQNLRKVEQERVFEGPAWNFLCLEDEIANPGDWRTTVVGQMPVVAAHNLGIEPKSANYGLLYACFGTGALIASSPF